jgi:PEP-CTERM motif
MVVIRRAAVALFTLVSVGAVGWQQPVRAGSITYEIQADTSGLVPGPGGLIDMQLGVSFPPASPSVSVWVFDPVTDGILGSSTPISGTATGDLATPGGVTANNITSTNELGQNFTVGSFFDVFVTLSGPEIGPGAVGPWSGSVLAVTIFDSGTGSEGAMFSVNPNVDTNGNPIVDGTIGVTTSGSVNVFNATVPEPTSLVLLGLGLGTLAAVCKTRIGRSKRIGRV